MALATRSVASVHEQYVRGEQTLSRVRTNVLLGSIYLRDALIDTAASHRDEYRAELARLRGTNEQALAGPDFTQPRVGRGLAYGDFDRDGDVDLLMTTNNGPAVLFRTDAPAGNRSIRLTLQGTKSNRDAIGALVRVYHGGTSQSRMVRSGSSYLSQSELPVTFGVGRRDQVERLVITWPSGRTDEFKNVAAGRSYRCVEGQGLV